MKTWELLTVELIYLAANILVARLEAHMFDDEQHRISHFKFFIGAVIISALPLLFMIFEWHSFKWIWLWLAVSTMHFPVFSISLNLFRKPPRAWDYRNTSDPNGSKWDKWLGKWYDEVLFGSVAVWVFLQFLIFWK